MLHKIRLLQERARSYPERIALRQGDENLNYQNLNEQVNQVYKNLLDKDLERDEILGVCIENSSDLMACLLAILKLGITCVPINPEWPVEEINECAGKLGRLKIIARKSIHPFLPEQWNAEVIFLEDLLLKEISSDNNTNVKDITDDNYDVVLYRNLGQEGKKSFTKIDNQYIETYFNELDNNHVSENKAGQIDKESFFDLGVLKSIWRLCNGYEINLPANPVLWEKKCKLIDFGLFYFAAQKEITEGSKYELLLEGAKFADQNDLNAIWVPERHFHSFGDQFPNPGIAAAAVSTITEKVRLRTGSLVLPLHDPVRVVEAWSMIDHLSNGRVELSIASGWSPDDFIFLPGAYAKRHDIMNEKLREVKELWGGKKATRINGLGKEIEVAVHPKPIQSTIPIWVTSGGNIATFRYAGSIGANILTMVGKLEKEEIKKNISAYRLALKQHGFDPKEGKVALMLHTFINEDLDYVKDTVTEPLKIYLEDSIDVKKNKKNQHLAYTAKDVEMLVDMAFQKFFNDDGLFGDIETCFNKVQAYADLGVTEIACLIDFGIDTKTALANLPGIAKLKQLIKQRYYQNLFFTKNDATANNVIPNDVIVKETRREQTIETSSQIFEESLDLFK